MELAALNRINTFLKNQIFKNGIELKGISTFEGDINMSGVMTSQESPLTAKNVGAVNSVTGLTGVEYGDGVNHVTVLTMDEMPVGSPVAAANLAFGKKLYTLPAGAQIVEAVYMDLALEGTTTIAGDTPDVGIGSVIASGAVAVLGGNGTFEDYLTGQTSGAIDGTHDIEKASGATAGALTGIALNISTSAKTIHLNVADGWAGAGDVTATGRIVLVWKSL